MSWVEKVKNSFRIKTGDGVEYTFDGWLNPSSNLEFNVTEFNFPNVRGTLFDRREAKGQKYSLEIYFQGENHLDKSAAFKESSTDKRYWTINHPIYGVIFCQPLSLNFDNKKQNITKITGLVGETITQSTPQALLIPDEKIEEDVEFLNETSAESFANNVEPEASDIVASGDIYSTYYAYTGPQIQDNDDGKAYFNLFRTAESKARNAASDANAYMLAAQAYIEAPAMFKQSLETRLDILVGNFNLLRTKIAGTVEDIDRSFRFIYESFGAANISAMALASVFLFDEQDYENRVKVQKVVDVLLLNYNLFLTDLDTLQSGSGGDTVDYLPNAQTIIDLNQLMYFAMANLFNIGLDAKQERFYTTPDDSDFITLAHRLYGLKNADESIDELMRNNNLGLNGILRIPKDTTLVYYV